MIQMRVVTFGSCMSEGVYAALTRLHRDRQWSYLNHVIHNRSDYFIDSFITNKQNPVDLGDIADADVASSPNFPMKSLISEARKFVENQNSTTIGINDVDWRSSFIKNLSEQSIDVIIMDNFMDIASRLVRDKITGKIFFILSASYSIDLFSQRYEWTGFVDADKSVLNYAEIIHWLRQIQPKAAIYFLPFPEKVYGHGERDSVLRAADFWKVLEHRPLSAEVLNVPYVGAHHMLSADDWCHYSPLYYEEIAMQIF